MKPILIVQQLLGDEYYDLLEESLDNGYFYSGDDCCVGAVIYGREWLEKHELDQDGGDVWYINFYAGDLKRALALVPFNLKRICFKRNHDHSKIKVWNMKTLLNKIGGQ